MYFLLWVLDLVRVSTVGSWSCLGTLGFWFCLGSLLWTLGLELGTFGLLVLSGFFGLLVLSSVLLDSWSWVLDSWSCLGFCTFWALLGFVRVFTLGSWSWQGTCLLALGFVWEFYFKFLVLAGDLPFGSWPYLGLTI